MKHLCKAILTAALCALPWSVYADDVLSFRGENRQGRYDADDVLKSWPEGGLEPVWVYDGLGAGWGSPAVVSRRVFINGTDPSDPTMETLTHLGRKGEVIWQVKTGPVWAKSHSSARSTPTVVPGAARGEGLIYVHTGGGTLLCVAEKDGKVLWRQDVSGTYEGRPGNWGYAESPVVVDDKVFVSPGGRKASMVAFHRLSGKVIWEAEPMGDSSSYAAPVQWKDQLIQVSGKNVFGVDIRNGAIRWKMPAFAEGSKGRNDINCNNVLLEDNRVLVISGYNDPALMFEIAPNGNSAKMVWTNEILDPHHGGAVLVDGKIYSSTWLNNSSGTWACVDWATGKTLYDTPWDNLGKGSIIALDDDLLIMYEEKRGTVALARPNPAKLDIISSFQFRLGAKEHWSHPVVSSGRLYIRRGNVLAMYDIRDKSKDKD